MLVDTNFLSKASPVPALCSPMERTEFLTLCPAGHTVQRKLPLLESMMDCLYAKCTPIITSCVMAVSSSPPVGRAWLLSINSLDEPLLTSEISRNWRS